MSGVGYIILWVFAAVVTVPVAAGLWYMVKALRAGDTALARSLVLPLLRVGLWLAGVIVLVASHGRSYRVTMLLSIAPALLRLPRDWPVLRAGLWPHRDKPAA